MLQHGEGITKTPLIWVQSLMALVLLFHFNAPGSKWKLDSHRSKILRKLQSLQVHPDVLHYSTSGKCNSVYCILASLRVPLNSAMLMLDTSNHPHFCLSAAQLCVLQKDISTEWQSTDV